MQEITIHDMLHRTLAALDAVFDAPHLESERLLCHVLQCDRSVLHAHPEARLDEAQQQNFSLLLGRRRAGVPLAYLVGMKEFWSLPLKVTPDVLVPRPETELLVELALARIPPGQSSKVIDLGTGSGAIALAIARERADCEVIATDISEAALAVARKNAKTLEINNVRFVPPGGWFRTLAGERFDIIVCNPPYVAEDDPQLDSDGVRFEPRVALAGGQDGLREIRKIVRDAGKYLKPGGWLLLEHGYDQGVRVRTLLARYSFSEIETRIDLAGYERVTLATKRSQGSPD